MKAKIEVDVPEWQIGQQVSIYFPDTMTIKETCTADKEILEQEPCNDCISRQYLLDNCVVDKVTMPYVSVNKIKNAPSVTPQPKIGLWITQWNVTHQKEYYCCSECREEFSYDGETGITMNNYNFCPNCGAKMRSNDK